MPWSILAERPDLDDGVLDLIVGIGIIQLILGFLAVVCRFHVMRRLLIYGAVNAADAPHVFRL